VFRRLRGGPWLLVLGFVGASACGQTSSDEDARSSGASGGDAGKGGARPGTGGRAPGTGGAFDGGAGGAPASGCDYADVHYDDGESFEDDCNTCTCNFDQVLCTLLECAPATGGSGGEPGQTGGRGGGPSQTGGRGGTGAGGDPQASKDCELQTGEICVIGTPTSAGHRLAAGMPLTLALRPDGCFSSSCTHLVESSCSFLGSERDFMISGFACVTRQGDACTNDCGGAPRYTCEAEATLEEGDYTIAAAGVAGTYLSKLEFSVPSTLTEEQRCTHRLQ
jgi:hypothetical protein